jgi:hypothetical protein
MPVKSYPILKTFIHEAYSRCLTSIQLRNTAGQQGYIQQNIYSILDKGKEDNDTNDANTIITQTAAAAATRSMLGNTYANTTSTIPTEVTVVINQLSANQTAIM